MQQNNLVKSAGFFITFIFILLSVNPVSGQRIFINEFLASNITMTPDMVDFEDYPDWLELYNAEDVPVDLCGYYLTDNLNDSTKWQIPANTIIRAKGFLRIWADGYDDAPGSRRLRPWLDNFAPIPFITRWHHLNFKLSRAGEELGLFSPDGKQIDAIEYDLQIPDVSYGRKPDGGSDWFYFGESTPAGANVTEGVINKEFASTPIFSMSGGFYQGCQSIILTVDSPAATIHYSTDCSRPGSSSPVYTLPIRIDSTTVIRARVFETGKLPGPVITHTYFINEDPSLAVLSIVGFPETLWGADIGIYQNELKEREIPISLEFFEPDGTPGFSLTAGMRLTGQAAFLYPQKPLTIYARDRYGTEEINYQLFPDRKVNKFKAIYLRNSGTPDNRHTMFRDALQHCLVINQMDLDCQAYRPAITFINGRYWGIYNIREKINTDYLAAHHNIDPTNLDFLEYEFNPSPYVLEGDANHYNTFLNFIQTNNVSLPQNYNHIKRQIDIDEYLNFHIAEIYCDNINYLYTNMKWWRERTRTGRWRWIFHDLDFGFGMPYEGFSSLYTNNTLYFVTETTNWPWATLEFRRLLDNPDFKNEFIQRFASYLNTSFRQDRVQAIVDSLKNMLLPEIGRHIDRWNDGSFILSEPPIHNIFAWLGEVEIMREFAEKRTSYQRQHIVDFFNLAGTAELVINTSEPGTGRILAHGIDMPTDNFTAIFYQNVPMILKAIPYVGFRFVKWQGHTDSPSDSITIRLAGNSAITAVFESTNQNILAAPISANTILTLVKSPYLAQSDLVIDPNITLQVQPGVEILMPQNANIYVHGSIQMNGSSNQPIYIRPNASAGATHWGAICLIDATGVSSLAHVILEGVTRGSDLDRHIGAISGYQSDFILDHVQILDAPQPVFAQYGKVEIKKCQFHSEFTGDLINIKYGTSALVENCDLRGNDHYDSDAIDYDGISNGVIRGNRIYNFYGINSDCIDLGEGTKNVLIESNLIFNCTDKGVSVGQASTAVIRRNIIVNCAQGVGIKDESSYAFIDQNTFYGNDYSVACFEKNIGVGGGSADVVNTIFSRSSLASYFVDDLSTINIAYSLSDTDPLPGLENIFTDPLFGNNFHLQASSPAINTGAPDSPADPDGSRADIGAHCFDAADLVSVIITEIHYNPAEGDDGEFIELCNTGKTPVSLSGYCFTEGIDFTFPPGASINAGEYLVLAKSASHYASLSGIQVFQWNGTPLSNEWANLKLEDSNGHLVDYVNYNSQYDWVTSPNGAGPSLELADLALENFHYANWSASPGNGGSPGQPNATLRVSGLVLNEFMAINDSVVADDHGDYDDWIELYNSGTIPIDIGGFYLTDDVNNPAMWQIPKTQSKLTTIQPEGYLMLWADGETEQGVLHLDFKLSGDGEQIGLFQKIGTDYMTIDRLAFGAQPGNVSYGRNPDGGTNWQFFTTPTPNFANSFTTVQTRASNQISTFLYQNRPNPFNAATTIRFDLAQTGKVQVVIYNVTGALVKTLVSGTVRAGTHQITWDGTNDFDAMVASGMYFYRVETNNYCKTKKMLMLR